MYYRVTVRGVGIYQYIDEACPQGDLRRSFKPDGSWLIKAGREYDGSISWWTEEGWELYVESGLRAWHSMITNNEETVERSTAINGEIVYEDAHQILVYPKIR